MIEPTVHLVHQNQTGGYVSIPLFLSTTFGPEQCVAHLGTESCAPIDSITQHFLAARKLFLFLNVGSRACKIGDEMLRWRNFLSLIPFFHDMPKAWCGMPNHAFLVHHSFSL